VARIGALESVVMCDPFLLCRPATAPSLPSGRTTFFCNYRVHAGVALTKSLPPSPWAGVNTSVTIARATLRIID
jgi:hypothetical protein